MVLPDLVGMVAGVAPTATRLPYPDEGSRLEVMYDLYVDVVDEQFAGGTAPRFVEATAQDGRVATA